VTGRVTLVTAAMKEPAYQLRRRLAAALGLFVAIIVVGAACTVLAAVRHGRAMAESHTWNHLSARTGALSALAREAYVHEAHAVISRDLRLADERNASIAQFERLALELRADLGRGDAARIDEIVQLDRDLANVFDSEIVPAVKTGNDAAVRAAHDRAVAIILRLTARADALDGDLHARAMHVGHAADREALLLVSGSVLAVLLAPLLAFLVARRLWRDFELPFGALRQVAERITLGDRAARVGKLPAAELVVVGQTFDAMLDELRRAEQRLIATERLAAIGRVAAGVAHEINNPVAVIRGYVKMMREDAATESAREELRIIDEEAANCQRIADDLLAYARAPSINRSRSSAAAILDEAVARLRASGEVGCEVTVEAEPAAIDVDPGRIRQVVTNLVRNACEATARAGANATVQVIGACSGTDAYRISVQDRGPGVPTADRDRVFEPFFTTRSDGTGLGLAVCYGLVTAHGGTIGVTERQGGGTIIRVDLPHVRSADGESQ
jgi:two-component system, NtrC family, sensor kinase